MANHIVFLNNKYVDWSTIVDAPVTYGMNEEAFIEYWMKEYGTKSKPEFDAGMERAKITGTSSIFKTVDIMIKRNRAGKGESNLSKEEIIEKYFK